MKKKIISVLLVTALSASMLFGCGNNNAVSGKTGQSEKTKTEAETSDKSAFQSSVLFCGSTSLYPIISSLASSFTEKYETWDKVNSSFPKENISIYVAPGGSGVGVSAAVEKTADFGMLARDIKDKEKESLGDQYQEYLVAKDALTVSVNAQNPVCEKMDTMDTDMIRRIFAGELKKWNEVESSLPAEDIHVYIRDLSGGAYEVFQRSVMGESVIRDDAMQSASMTLLATNIAEDPWAIGYAGFGAYNKANEKEKVLFAMKVDGVEATEDNILSGAYKIQRPVMFVTGDAVSESEQAFIDYVFSETGYETVEKNGYIPAFTVK